MRPIVGDELAEICYGARKVRLPQNRENHKFAPNNRRLDLNKTFKTITYELVRGYAEGAYEPRSRGIQAKGRPTPILPEIIGADLGSKMAKRSR